MKLNVNEDMASTRPDNIANPFSDPLTLEHWIADGRENTLTVVIPAHNEAGNLELTVSALFEVLDAAAVEHEILIVNDGSTDATVMEIIKDIHKGKNLR